MLTVTGVAALHRSVTDAVALTALANVDVLPKFKEVAAIVQVVSTRAWTVSVPEALNLSAPVMALQVVWPDRLPNKLNWVPLKVEEKVPGAGEEPAGATKTTLKGKVTLLDPLAGRTSDRGPARGHVVSMPTCVDAVAGL
jgi:hypothetical protein